MLLFVSDLHLSDREETSGAHVPTLLAELEATLERASEQGVERPRLVLLGDIFELLKSERWLATTTRTWLPPSAEGEAVVGAVFDAIARAHAGFFTGLAALARRFPALTLEYLPGNHDHEMNTALGRRCRTKLRRLLPLEGAGDELFSTLVVDPEHDLLAKHGHEWDRQNRTSEGVFAVGDVVVIELVARLPALVRAALSAPAVPAFVEELDNVSPQEPRAMAHWLLAGLARLGASEPTAREVIAEALVKSLECFRRALGQARFESVSEGLWARLLGKLATGLVKGFDPMALACRLPRAGERDPGPGHHARLDLETAAASGGPCRFMVTGHTHRAEMVPLVLLGGAGRPPSVYINCGTWRRVHRLVEPIEPKTPPSFVSRRSECLVTVFSPAEQSRGLPAYEVKTFERGLSD